jgi:predicted MFS family arabinose efflux permease
VENTKSAGSLRLSRLLFVLAMVAGTGIANIYYNQSLLDSFRQSFPRSSWIGGVPAATQLGFACGMLLLAPLGDCIDRRRLILLQVVGLCISLGVATISPTLPVLLGASVAIGFFATLAQQAGPFAAELVPPEKRGHAVGSVMSGLLLGILLARSLSGLIAEYFGWRAVFSTAIVEMVVLAAFVVRFLPRSRPTVSLRYGTLFASLWNLIIEFRILREAALTGASLFAAFSIFWSVMALLLAGAPFHLGPRDIGLFGIIGAAGALAAPLAGKLADHRGPRVAVTLAISLVAISFVVFMVSASSMAGLIIGVILLDVGLQIGQTPNVSRVLALRPQARSRLNTIYMVSYFSGGAVGSAVGAIAWQTGGWIGICLAGLFFCVVAAASHFCGREERTMICATTLLGLVRGLVHRK